MATSSNIGNATARTVVVVALAVHPAGVFGYGTNVDGIVTGVDEGSPAYAAGIRVGDRMKSTHASSGAGLQT